MATVTKNLRWSLSVYQLVDSFAASEANISSFVSKKTELIGPLVLQIEKENEPPTWVLLGAKSDPELLVVG